MGEERVTLTAVIQSERLKNCTSERLKKYLEELNSDQLRIDTFIAPNVLVFQTNNAKAAGRRIEWWLLKHFKKKKDSIPRKTKKK